MDIEKAKELLNLCPICIGNHEGCNCRRHNAYVWVFEQLEKQIPKKPVETGWLYCECGLPLLMATVSDGRRYEYCPICGQRIDWSEFDKDTNVPSKGESDED